MGKLKKDIIRLEKEKVIRVAKKDLISHITTVLETDPDSSSKLDEFLKLCKRVEYTIRAWHNLEFQDMMVMDKSHFKIADNEEIEVANSGQYLLHLPIVVDESKVCTWLDKVFNKNTPAAPKKRDSESETDEDDFFVERIRLDSMDLSLQNLLLMNTIQEPTFERIIVVYRQATTDEDLPERGIHIKHFKNIPMADLEIVLPEKKNPGLTPMDWLSFIGSAVVGLVAIVTSIETTKLDLWVAFAILSTVIGYIATTYFRIWNKCEWLIQEWYKDEINFDVDDAVKKLEKLEIVTKDSEGLYSTVGLERANKIIGTTTEEVVLSAKYKEMRAESEAHGDHAIGKASVAEPEDAMTSDEERERLLAGFAED
ncbi:hypothetical protein ACLB2K_061310 [Fragaria x ananassa]